jgi:hypothetical protein
MSIKLSESQTELLTLMYANVNNANIYCESLLTDKNLHKGVKEEAIRPLYTHLKFVKTALDLKMNKNKADARREAFGDTLVYDEVARLMAYMSYDNRIAVEEFAKSLIPEDV